VCGFQKYECPEKRETPDILVVVEISGFDDVRRSDEPVEGGKRRGAVAGFNMRCGVAGRRHDGGMEVETRSLSSRES